MSKKLILIALLLVWAALLVGCERPSETILDQCMRNQVFERCLTTVPRGPESTRYNDWAEVVGECETAAMYQSYRLRAQVKPECRNE